MKNHSNTGRLVPFGESLAALSRNQRQYQRVVPMSEPGTGSVAISRAVLNARDLRIMLVGFERIMEGQPEKDNPVAVIFDGTLTCKITGVRFETALGLVIEAR